MYYMVGAVFDITHIEGISLFVNGKGLFDGYGVRDLVETESGFTGSDD